jgi:hypothetical protein
MFKICKSTRNNLKILSTPYNLKVTKAVERPSEWYILFENGPSAFYKIFLKNTFKIKTCYENIKIQTICGAIVNLTFYAAPGNRQDSK